MDQGNDGEAHSEILLHAYSLDSAPSDYHQFASLEHTLAEQCSNLYENERK